MLQKQQELIAENLNASGVRRVALLDVPKENWGTRPAVILDIADRLSYHALADNLSVNLIGSMSPDVYGLRLPPVEPKPGIYSHNNKQWDGYRFHLMDLADLYPVALKTDIVSFFASIPVALVQEAIQDRCQKNEITKRLCDMVDSFGSIPDRSGLVQRSTASAVLANMYVEPLDDVLKHHSFSEMVFFGKKLAHRSFTRWMDDIWLFGRDTAAMRRAQMDLQAAAQTLGLNLNYAKTEVLEGPDVAEQAKEIEHSAVDDALDGEPDFGPLEALIDKLLLHPEKAGRTSLKFTATRMRKHDSRYRIQEVIALAPRMPHAADGWSRLFKEVFTNESLQDWYLQYVDSDWAAHEWSIAHFGRMFPSDVKARKPLCDFFEQSIRDANLDLSLGWRAGLNGSAGG
jgi:hypothetical protein